MTASISRARPAPYSDACSIPTGLPCTTTCEPRSVCGFSSTGLKSVRGARPAARACTACALPISPPSAQAAALFDMFCGLNGATRMPLRFAARQSPATTTDFPASDAVPWIINARALTANASIVPPNVEPSLLADDPRLPTLRPTAISP